MDKEGSRVFSDKIEQTRKLDFFCFCSYFLYVTAQCVEGTEPPRVWQGKKYFKRNKSFSASKRLLHFFCYFTFVKLFAKSFLELILTTTVSSASRAKSLTISNPNIYLHPRSLFSRWSDRAVFLIRWTHVHMLRCSCSEFHGKQIPPSLHMNGTLKDCSNRLWNSHNLECYISCENYLFTSGFIFSFFSLPKCTICGGTNEGLQKHAHRWVLW